MSGMETLRRRMMVRLAKGDVEDEALHRVESSRSSLAAGKADAERKKDRFERQQKAALELLKTRKAILGVMPRKNEYDI